MGQPIMKLQMLKGSFLPADDGAAMDAEVWSRLPEELVLEVVQRVPAGASRFRLQLVSRAWRRVLTSADLRTRIAAAPEQEQQERRVVARAGRISSRSSNCSVGVTLVDIDLASFVPESFWHSECRTFAVVAAADGLVCISNSKYHRPVDRLCVLNPLTRTCKVLPLLPLDCKPEKCLALTPTAVTILGWLGPRQGARAPGMLVATYDMAGGGGDWDCAEYRPAEGVPADGLMHVAPCAGRQTFMLDGWWMHMLEPGPGGTLVDEAAIFSPMALALPGVESSQCWLWTPVRYPSAGVPCRPNVSRALEAHRGAVFFLMTLDEKGDGEVDMLVGVWRLAREPFRWQAVARLGVADLERLTGLDGLDRKGACQGWSLCGVQESLLSWWDVAASGWASTWTRGRVGVGPR